MVLAVRTDPGQKINFKNDTVLVHILITETYNLSRVNLRKESEKFRRLYYISGAPPTVHATLHTPRLDHRAWSRSSSSSCFSFPFPAACTLLKWLLDRTGRILLPVGINRRRGPGAGGWRLGDGGPARNATCEAGWGPGMNNAFGRSHARI